jgi:hypothetical protein
MEDFVDLKTLLDNHQVTYLLNLSMTEPEMVGIIEELSMITEHPKPTIVYDPEKWNRWRFWYW